LPSVAVNNLERQMQSLSIKRTLRLSRFSQNVAVKYSLKYNTYDEAIFHQSGADKVPLLNMRREG